MKINLSQLCDIIAKKYQIPREEIFLNASFPIPEYYYSSDLPICEGDHRADRFFLPFQYSRLPEDARKLDIAVFQNKKYIMDISVKNVSPNQNNVHKLMNLDYSTSTIGGGWYNHCPFFSIRGTWCSGTDCNNQFVKRYLEFVEKTEIDTANITKVEEVTTNKMGFATKSQKVDKHEFGF